MTQLEVYEDIQKTCTALMRTPHYAKMGAEGIFAIVSKARSLGMDVIEALNGGLYCLQGKVGMTAESMAAMIRQRGHSIVKDAKSNNEVCILHGKRGDNGDTWTISFGVDDARRAGLLKNMYEKYPATMLYNRAMSFLARQLFPDVIRGAGYTPEELKEIITNREPLPAPLLTEVVEFVSPEQCTELRALFAECESTYHDQVLQHLKIMDLDQVPAHLYDRIKNAASKKRLTNTKVSEIQLEGLAEYYNNEVQSG